MFDDLKGLPVYLKGIIFLLVLLPLWWALGIDQFIFPAVIFLLFIIFLFQYRKDLRIPLIIVPMLVFILIYAISGFFVVEKIRYFVYAYNLIQNISVVLLLIMIAKALRNKKYLNNVIWTIFIIIFFAALLGAIGIILKEKMQFETPMARYMPEAFKDSDFLKLAFTKRVLNPRAWIMGIKYPRVHSLFIHSNSFAQVLIVAVPLIFFLNSNLTPPITAGRKYIFRILLFFGLALVFFNLLSTTDRTAIIGLAAGFIWWFFFWEKWPGKSKKNLYITIIIGIIIIILWSLFLVQYFDEILSARPGSLSTRMIIYKNTISAWMKSPVFGWGVTMDIMDVFPEEDVYEGIPPMGTHSTYLGILFRQGIAGLVVFIWFLSYLWFSIGQSYRRLLRSGDRTLFTLIGFTAWGVICNLVQGVFNMLDLVSTSFHITWINIAILITAVIMVLRKDNRYDLTGKV